VSMAVEQRIWIIFLKTRNKIGLYFPQPFHYSFINYRSVNYRTKQYDASRRNKMPVSEEVSKSRASLISKNRSAEPKKKMGIDSLSGAVEIMQVRESWSRLGLVLVCLSL
jgi:hypothetical protein